MTNRLLQENGAPNLDGKRINKELLKLHCHQRVCAIRSAKLFKKYFKGVTVTCL
jgi:hypothetical protein